MFILEKKKVEVLAYGRIRGTGARPRKGGKEMEDGGSGEKGRASRSRIK